MGSSSNNLMQNPILTSTKGITVVSSVIPSKTQAPLTLLNQVAIKQSNSSQELTTTSVKSVTATQSYTPHDPIEVSNDAELEAIASRGTGTAVDPYVLEGWNITTSGTTGISITSTTAHFIVQNCWVDTNSSYYFTGISIDSTGLGTVTIVNNICQNNKYGISLENSDNVTLRNNFCAQNEYSGIFLGYSDNATLSNNICAQNNHEAIFLFQSGNATLSNNTCAQNKLAGIFLLQSGNVILSNNSCTQNYGYYSYYTNQWYWAEGISIEDSENAILSNNTCAQNNGHGVILYRSDNATLSHNICSQNNRSGIFFRESDDCSIIGNTLFESADYGVFLDGESETNQINLNSFLNNTNGSPQAFDDGSDNVFAYNYWDEWTTPDTNGDEIVDNPYHVAGSATNQDSSPLIAPAHSDFDGDGIPNWYEVTMGLNFNFNDSVDDLDQDNLSNLEEYQLGTHHNDPDTDGDGLGDGEEVKTYTTDPLNSDSDLDDIPDGWEVNNHLNPLINDATNDPDHDSLVNLDEYLEKTDPQNADSDGDGLSDGEEVKIHKTNPLDSDSDNDFFPDGLDHSWWGNPRNNWDNLLTRSMLLLLMGGLVGLGLWAGFIAYQLPKLQRDLHLLHQHFQQYVQQFQERVTEISNLESVEELEAAADQIYEVFQSYEEFFLFAQHLMARKWLPAFLYPDLSAWNSTFATMQQTYEDFQQIRLERLGAKY